jgi:hypothetical protein
VIGGLAGAQEAPDERRAIYNPHTTDRDIVSGVSLLTTLRPGHPREIEATDPKTISCQAQVLTGGLRRNCVFIGAGTAGSTWLMCILAHSPSKS